MTEAGKLLDVIKPHVNLSHDFIKISYSDLLKIFPDSQPSDIARQLITFKGVRITGENFASVIIPRHFFELPFDENFNRSAITLHLAIKSWTELCYVSTQHKSQKECKFFVPA